MNVFMIQGFYSQPQEFLDIRHVPIKGAPAVLNRGVVQEMFSGYIFPRVGGWSGYIHDSIGKSRLGHVELDDAELRFVKAYDERPLEVTYEVFRDDEDDSFWEGRWRGDHGGGGDVMCTLTPMPAAMRAMLR